MDAQMCSHSLDQILFIVRHGMGEAVSQVARSAGAVGGAIVHATGTAPTELRMLLGLDDKLRELVVCMAHEHWTKNVLARVNADFSLKKAGEGIAMVIPMNKACGINAMLRLKAKYHPLPTVNEKDCEELHIMDNNYELLTIIVKRGYADDAMSVARAAGATGGTIINARGTSVQEASKLFGVAVDPEKEILLILAEEGMRDAIMKAVEVEAGLATPGRGLAFATPVSMAMGLTSVADKGEA